MTALTKDEQTFLNRAIPHIMAGKSFEDAIRAVLADDERIVNFALAKNEAGNKTRNAISASVYYGIHGRNAVDRALA